MDYDNQPSKTRYIILSQDQKIAFPWVWWDTGTDGSGLDRRYNTQNNLSGLQHDVLLIEMGIQNPLLVEISPF